MWTVLFDIDGTLIRTNGAGMKAMGQTMTELFGSREIPQVSVHGRTDRGILSELFEKLDMKVDDDLTGFFLTYSQRLESALRSEGGNVLPGVMDLLDKLSSHPGVALGILTGNAREPARIKLEHFQLSEYFLFGGFGDDHSDRNDVAAQAVSQAKDFLGSRFDAAKTWVIGDTTNDIRCARAVGAKAMTVATGGDSMEQLLKASPDLHFADLTHADNWIDSLFL